MICHDRLMALFAHLVSLNSPSRGERPVADAVIAQLHALGVTPQEDHAAEKIGGNAGNLYAYIEGPADRPPLLFSAHLDTVEPSCGKRAIIAPDGRITSDGTTVLGADDAAGLAAILEALAVLKEQGLPHRPLELLFTVAEEPYCVGARAFDFSTIRSKEAYVFDLDGPVGGAAYQAPTILSFRAVFSGRAAHAAFDPEQGIHAIRAAADAVSRIECGRMGSTTVNIGTIAGGTAANIVPDTCALTGEIRSFSDTDAHRKLAAIEAACRQAANTYGAELTFESESPLTAYRVDPARPVVQRFKAACTGLGLPVTLRQTYGGSDNNALALHGVEGIVVATAMNQCHSCAEYTTEEELDRAAALALALMMSKE